MSLPEIYKPKAKVINDTGLAIDLNPELKKENRLSKKLDGIREHQRIYREMKKIVIQNAKTEAVEEQMFKNDQEKTDTHNHQERLSHYKSVISEMPEKDEAALRGYAFGEITDFAFNEKVFKGDHGWLKKYERTGNQDKKSLEVSVLDEQYAELEKIRVTLAEARVGELLPKLYDGLNLADKKTEKQSKLVQVKVGVNNFFVENRQAVEKMISAGSVEEQKEMKLELYQVFKENIFADLVDPDKKQLIAELFDNLIFDYAAMMDQKAYVKELNPEMVSAMTQSGITEEQWNEQLAKQAESKAKQLKEDAKKKNDEAKVLASPPVTPKFDTKYYPKDITAAEKISEESKISFVYSGSAGEYIVRFPSENGVQESKLSVRAVIENGKRKEMYVFEDPLLDRRAIVGEKGFRAQVNGLYLDHVMNESIKRGADYEGPDLNAVLHDKEMSDLAGQLFYPRQLSQAVVTLTDVRVFKNLMIVLTNKSNNIKGEGIYGDLTAIRTRINLLHFALSVGRSDKTQVFYNTLSHIEPDILKIMSVEQLCKLVGIEKNSGNFTKN